MTQTTAIRTFGWDRVKLSEHSFDDLETLRQQVSEQHALPVQGRGLHLFDKSGQRKLDALAWAVFNKQAERADA